MGVFTDWLDNQIVIGDRPYTGERRVAYNEINWHRRRTDPSHLDAYKSRNEIQGVTQAIPPLLRYRLGFTMSDSTEILTGLINAPWTGTLLESVINVACAPIVPDWVDGDIEYISGSLVAPPLILEFSGDSVKEQNWRDLRAWQVFPFAIPLTTTTIQDGQPYRYTWSVMYELGLYGPPPPDPGDDLPENAELFQRPDETNRWPSGSLRDKLARQCAIEEGNSNLENQLQDLFNIQRRWGVNPR